jgi:protein-L-isoaspartate(D-aspartate) O-methyltransferase
MRPACSEKRLCCEGLPVAFDLHGIGMTSQRTRDRLVRRLADNGITDAEVLSVIATVPRHIFVDEALAHRAYEDSALPIGFGQTISQPFVVALMTATLLNVPRLRVLEVGTGSGYQTAVLASLVPRVGRVYSVERLTPLIARAQERLQALGLNNVRVKHGDGYDGWLSEGPFDGILVTAAPRVVPDTLLEQLAPGGRLIVPVGDDGVQELKVYDRSADPGEAKFSVDTAEYVRFVPLLKGVK